MSLHCALQCFKQIRILDYLLALYEICTSMHWRLVLTTSSITSFPLSRHSVAVVDQLSVVLKTMNYCQTKLMNVKHFPRLPNAKLQAVLTNVLRV